MIRVGATVVVKGRIAEVIEFNELGDVRVRDAITETETWVDFYTCRFIDPHESPGAVLEAMATIRAADEDGDDSDIRDGSGGFDVGPPSPSPDWDFLQPRAGDDR